MPTHMMNIRVKFHSKFQIASLKTEIIASREIGVNELNGRTAGRRDDLKHIASAADSQW